MIKTVDAIQSEIAGIVDQDEDTGNISTTDYSLRLNYMNRALLEWAEVYDWQSLYKEYLVNVSTSTGNASIALPSDFRKPASFPVIDGTEYPDVRPQEDGQFSDSDKRVNFLGNPNNGYVMVVKGVALSSGTSIKVPYYSSPGSLASPANIVPIPNPEFITQRTIAYIWESREDARFPQAKADAQRILSNLIEYENVFHEGSTNNRIKTEAELKHGFRIGRD